MDFCGAFRLQEFDLFSVPIKKAQIGTKMKRALSSSLRLAARLKQDDRSRRQDRDDNRCAEEISQKES